MHKLKMALRAVVLAMIVLGLTVLNGCSRSPSWFVGDWVFDSERSQQELSTVQKTSPDDLALSVAPLLLTMMNKSELIITNKDITTLGTDKENSFSYEILHTTNEECIVKKSDGSVEHYGRDNADIYAYSTGSIHLKVFFKRKS